jgi:hypothetical protein
LVDDVIAGIEAHLEHRIEQLCSIIPAPDQTMMNAIRN